MGIIKVIVILILVIFAGIGAYQNRDFLLETESLSFHVMGFHKETPKLHIGLMFSVCFFSGMLLAFFFSLLSRYKAGRTIKFLNQVKNEQAKKIAELEAGLPGRQSAPLPPSGTKTTELK